MTLENNIRKTIIATLDLYKTYGEKLFGLSLSFSLVSSIFAMIIAIIPCFIFLEFMESSQFKSGDLLDDLMSNALIMQRLMDIGKSVLILNIGLFGLYVLDQEKIQFEGNNRLKDLVNIIPKSIWINYMTFLLVLLIVNFISFRYIFDTAYNEDGFMGLIDYFGAPTKKLKFYNWLNSIIELIKIYLPYILTMFLIFKSFETGNNLKRIKRYKTPFFTVLILSFCIDILSFSVIDYVDFYIINLIKIPFDNELFPSFFGFLVVVILIAFFYLGFAAMIAYPFKHEQEEITIS